MPRNQFQRMVFAFITVVLILAEWLKLMCYNFPFAFFTQLFLIHPVVRTVFKVIFANDIKMRQEEQHSDEKQTIIV